MSVNKEKKCYDEVKKPAFKRFMELKKTLDDCSTTFKDVGAINTYEGKASIAGSDAMSDEYKRGVVDLLSEILNRNKVITDYKSGSRFPPPPPPPGGAPPLPPGGGSSSGGSKKKKKKHKKKSKKNTKKYRKSRRKLTKKYKHY